MIHGLHASWLLKVWSVDPQHWHHLGASQKCRISCPTTDPRSQILHFNKTPQVSYMQK